MVTIGQSIQMFPDGVQQQALQAERVTRFQPGVGVRQPGIDPFEAELRFAPVPTDVSQPTTVAPPVVSRRGCLTTMTAAQCSNHRAQFQLPNDQVPGERVLQIWQLCLGTGNDIFVAPFHAMARPLQQVGDDPQASEVRLVQQMLALTQPDA